MQLLSILSAQRHHSVIMRLILFLSVILQIAYAEKLSYDGDVVLKIEVFQNDEKWDIFMDILNKHIPVQDQDIWKFPSKTRPAYVRIGSQFLFDVRRDLDSAHIKYNVQIDDVGRLIREAEEENDRIKASRETFGDKSIVGTFPTYDEVIDWMNETSQLYPELASTFSIGYTVLGRPMHVLKLGLNGGNKWRVWMDAGVHAREWLAPATATYIADQLIQGYVNNDPEVLDYLSLLDFEILAVANPDGYEYCFTGDRLWRKNRRPITADCTGVDLNRNFGFEWGGVGAATDPCDNTYMGPYAESEHEVLNIINHVLPESEKYVWYMAYHTWGELFFTRWDYTTDVPPDHTELLDLAQRTVNAINQVNGEIYLAGTAPDLMYAFSGSSSDWSRGTVNIPYPYLVELRDSDGEYGFVAPPEEIIPCGAENWAGAKVILDDIIANYGGTTPP